MFLFFIVFFIVIYRSNFSVFFFFGLLFLLKLFLFRLLLNDLLLRLFLEFMDRFFRLLYRFIFLLKVVVLFRLDIRLFLLLLYNLISSGYNGIIIIVK